MFINELFVICICLKYFHLLYPDELNPQQSDDEWLLFVWYSFTIDVDYLVVINKFVVSNNINYIRNWRWGIDV